MLICTNELPHRHAASPASAWQEGVEQAIQGSGLRLTGPRRAILHHIAQLSAPFTAEALVEELKLQQGLSSRATIYRMVDWLCASGWIVRVQSDQTHNTYTRLLPGHHHNLFCTSCGSTVVIGGCNIEALLTPILTGVGFEIHGHMLELYGHCERCRAPHS